MLLGAPLWEWHIGPVGERGAIDLDLFRDVIASLTDDREHRATDILGISAEESFG